MPIEPSETSADSRRLSIASVRILRLALGTSLSLWFSQAVGWQLSFVAPVITMLVLGLPVPALKLKSGIVFVLVMTLSLYAGTLLLPTLLHQPAVGMLLLGLALYWSFYFTAKGGPAILGTFATVGIALTTGVGSVSVGAVLELASSMSIATAAGVLFVWVAHALIPDSMAIDAALPSAGEKPQPPKPDLAHARWSAFRSLLIVMPVAIWMLFSAASTAYIPVMLKVASMGQQATNDAAQDAGRSLILSTIIGGVGAVIGWEILSIAPTLLMYALFVGLAGLIMGPKIFQGTAMHPQAATWSYGYLTMLVILAPAVMDGIGGDSASLKFWDRIIMFGGTTLYAVVAVYVVDAFHPAKTKPASD
jgi:hypothetical protein